LDKKERTATSLLDENALINVEIKLSQEKNIDVLKTKAS
jgi:hypothetical protein